MKAFAVVIAAGLGSYLFRISMLVVAARRGLPQFFERTARSMVPIAFAALAAGALFNQIKVGPAVPPLVAAAVAAVAVRRTRSAHAALLVGMPVLWAMFAVAPR